MNRSELIEAASREAAGVILFHPIENKGDIATASDTIAVRILDLVEPMIRAEARAEALEFCCEDRAAELRADIQKHFRENLPPYLFPSTNKHVFPGMEAITLHEAIMDVWRMAEEQILELIDEESKS